MELAISLLALCFTLAGVETLHGIFRNAVIAPRIGTQKAKRLSIVSGTLLMVIVCYFWIPPLGIRATGSLLLVGLLLAVFMALFDMVLARYIIHQKWRVILKDFNPAKGNYLLIGLVILALVPLGVVRIQGM